MRCDAWHGRGMRAADVEVRSPKTEVRSPKSKSGFHLQSFVDRSCSCFMKFCPPGTVVLAGHRLLIEKIDLIAWLRARAAAAATKGHHTRARSSCCLRRSDGDGALLAADGQLRSTTGS
jgi:hypothetical protein